MRRVAMEEAKKKDSLGPQLTLGSLYLILYNLLQAIGWTMVLVKLLAHVFVHETYVGLYNEIGTLLRVFQTLAILEVVHAAVGLVRSNPAVTGIQVASRVFLVWGILHLVTESRDGIGFLLLCLAWCLTEVIRYSYYMGAIVEYTPFILQYLRYTLFIVLYPMGVVGEMLSIYKSLPYIREREILTVPLPNRANMSFNYYYFLMIVMLTYVPGFPQLYFHMFSQRKKILGPKPKKED